MEPIAVGQVWKEVDPRFTRYVQVEAIHGGHRANIAIRTVIEKSGVWEPKKGARLSYADGTRFDGRRGGYAFHQAARAQQSGA
jgi:hypothetical protein